MFGRDKHVCVTCGRQIPKQFDVCQECISRVLENKQVEKNIQLIEGTY